MGLIKCVECGTEISEYAEKCPKCGYPCKDMKQQDLYGVNISKNGICLYKNVEYDFHMVEEMLNNNKLFEATKILCEELELKPLDARFLIQVIQYNNNHIPKNLDRAVEEYQAFNVAQREARQVHCPRCGSTSMERGRYVPLPWMRAKKYWYCNNCHTKFYD